MDMYKEDESETTCTFGSEDETSEDDEDDADESSLQEDGDNDKHKKTEKNSVQKISSSEPTSQPEPKGIESYED